MELKDLTAVILVGGFGTRLRPVISDKPKALAEIRGKPFLAYQLDQLAEVGIRKVVLCIGHLGKQIQDTFGDKFRTLKIVYSQEKSLLGTGGALRLALSHISSDTVLVLNGDSFCKTDLKKFFNWYLKKEAKASLLLTEVSDTARFGSVVTGKNDQIAKFKEKGKNGEGWINAGVYLIAKSRVSKIPAKRIVSLEQQIFPNWIGKGFYGYKSEGKFLDIGTPQSYILAEQFFAPPFVLLDRDGTIIHEKNYLSHPDQVELIPKAGKALYQLKKLGLGIVVVTNQSGVGRGFFDLEQLKRIHSRLSEVLEQERARLDGIYFCPHTPDESCLCRKPKPGLVEQAVVEHKFDPKMSFVVGDKAIDIELGKSVGATTILVRTGYGLEVEKRKTVTADYIVDDLLKAADIIRQLLAKGRDLR